MMSVLKSRRSSVGLGVVLAVVACWFSPWWAKGRVLAPLDIPNEMMQPWRGDAVAPEVKNHAVSDSVTQYLGYRLFAEEQLRSEGRIGWSDLTYGGTPTYANTMALFDDWSMQLHKWFDFWTAWHLGLIGQVVLAGSGMFLFLRGREIGGIWAVAGAIAWAANSQFVAWVNHRWALSSFCWLPWVFLAMDRFRAGRRRWGYAVPVFLALSFLGGTLQHAGLVVLAVVAYWLSESRGGAWRTRLEGVGRHALWGAAGIGLAAFMFFPQIEAFRISSALGLHTGMFQGLDRGVYPEGWLQPLANLAAYPLMVFPSLLGSCDSVDLLKLFKSELFYVAYFGSLPVVLSWLGIFRKETPALARWLIILGLVLPLTPLVRLLYQRLFLLYIFGGILAFTHFMQHAAPETKRRVFRWVAGFSAMALVAWSVGSVVLALAGDGLLVKLREAIVSRGAGSTFGFFGGWMEDRAERLIERLFIWSPWQLIPLALFAVGLAGLRLTGSPAVRPRLVGALLVVGAVTGEVTLFAQRWVSWSDPARQPLYAETAETRELKERVGVEGRVKNVIHPTAHMPNTPLMQNMLVPYGLATINGYDSIVPDGMMLPGDPELDARVLARAGVGHLVVPAAVEITEPEWREVWRSESTVLYENDWPAGRYVFFDSRSGLERFVAGREHDGGAVLEEVLGEMNRRRFEVPAAGWVRLAENHVDGWQWRSGGGGWREVERLGDGSMGFAVEKQGEVEMRFAPTSRRLGWGVSGITVLMMAGIGLVGARKAGRGK